MRGGMGAHLIPEQANVARIYRVKAVSEKPREDEDTDHDKRPHILFAPLWRSFGIPFSRHLGEGMILLGF